MEEFVEKLKQEATKMVKEAEKITTNVVEKTGNMVSKTKINYAISSNNGKIKDLLAEIGQVVYDEYKNGSEFPEAIAEKLALIDNIYDEIDGLKAKIADVDNSVVCPNCKSFNRPDSSYCTKCGTKI